MGWARRQELGGWPGEGDHRLAGEAARPRSTRWTGSGCTQKDQVRLGTETRHAGSVGATSRDLSPGRSQDKVLAAGGVPVQLGTQGLRSQVQLGKCELENRPLG